MLALMDGSASDRKDGRGGRSILSIRTEQPPESSSQLGGVEQPDNSEALDDTQRWELDLWAARNVWSVRQHRRGLFGKRLSRDEAQAALTRALAALKDGAW